MVKMEPYDYQKKTNIKEHNDIVGKINEIVTVINNTNIESIDDRFSAINEKIDTINNTDSLQWVDIEKLKTNDPIQDATLTEHTNEIKGITESLISGVSIVDGYNTGTFKVRIDRKGTVSIDSNEYPLESPVSIELIQGTGPSMFKCQITLSDGRTLVSNDFVFTTEYIGQDVYISSFTFKAGNVDGTISADIGLSSGATIEANNFTIPTPPTVANSINDLNARVESLENTTVSDARITAIETKNSEQDSAIETNANDISLLNSEIENIRSTNPPTDIFMCNLTDYMSEITTTTSSSTAIPQIYALFGKSYKQDKDGNLFLFDVIRGIDNTTSVSRYEHSGTIDAMGLLTAIVNHYKIPIGRLSGNHSIRLCNLFRDDSDWLVSNKSLTISFTVSNGVITTASASSSSRIVTKNSTTTQRIGFVIKAL